MAASNSPPETPRAVELTGEILVMPERGIAVGARTGDLIPTEKMKARLQ